MMICVDEEIVRKQGIEAQKKVKNISNKLLRRWGQHDMNDEFKNDYERVEHLQKLLICSATGEIASDADYAEYRQYILGKPVAKELLPAFVRTSRDLAQFWQFIGTKGSTYAERREFLWAAFRPLLDHLEKGEQLPAAEQISSTLKTLDPDNIHGVWTKALSRATGDPEGAITAARTLLEAVCKRLLEEMGIPYSSNPDLPELYSLVGKQLNLSPTQHTEKAFKQILGGCSSIVDALGSLRNKIGDAHGHGKAQVRPLPRHASLAVNLSGAMALFLVDTWKARQAKNSVSVDSDLPWLKKTV